MLTVVSIPKFRIVSRRLRQGFPFPRGLKGMLLSTGECMRVLEKKVWIVLIVLQGFMKGTGEVYQIF